MTPEDAFKHSWIKAGIKELKEKMERGNATATQAAESNTLQGNGAQVAGTGLPTINDSQNMRMT